MHVGRLKEIIFFILLAFTPVVIHVGVIPIVSEIPESIPWRTEYDIYTFWKSWFVISASFPLLLFVTRAPQRLQCFVILISCFLMFSMTCSKYPYLALYGAPNYNEGGIIMMAYLTILLAATQLRLKILKLALQLAVLLVFLVALLQWKYGNFLTMLTPLVGPYVFWSNPRPIFSTLGNPNHLGLFCALLIPLFIKRIPVLLMLLFMLVGCGSRGAWLSVLTTTSIFIWNKRFYGKQLLLGLCAALLGGYYARHTILGVINRTAVDSNLGGRVEVWKRAIPMMKGKIVWGSGPTSFLPEFPQWTSEIVDRPHNIYLGVIHTSGVLSLLIWGCVLVTFFRYIIPRPEPQARALFLSVLGFLIAAFFTDSHVGVTPLFCAILGCGYNLALQPTPDCRRI